MTDARDDLIPGSPRSAGEEVPDGVGNEPDPERSRPIETNEPLDPDGYGRTGEPGERAEIGKPFVRPARLAGLAAVFAAIAILGGFPVVVLVFAVLVMIFFHELGHYVMARRSGMKVTEFMIGFGPRIFSFRRGDVEYGLKAIPAGAYVKIIGMANIEEVPPEDESQTYRQKGYWARMGVAVAGSTMHFIMALVLIGASFVFVGRFDPAKWQIDSIADGSAAQIAGVEMGDRVLSVDGVAVASHTEMAEEAQARPGKTIPIVVLRDGKRVELTATINERFIVFGTTGEEFQVYVNGDGGLSVSVPEGSPLEDSGLLDGDTVTAVNSTPVATVAEMRTALSERAVKRSGAFQLGVVHPGSDGDATVRLDLGDELGVDESVGFFGVGQEVPAEKLGVLAAVPAAFDWFGDTTVQSVQGMVRFFSPSSLSAFATRTFSTAPGETHVPVKAQTNKDTAKATVEREGNRIVSIVGAIGLGADLTEDGWGSLLAFMAFLNMAVGILNLIPLPPFDGGHVALGTYEKLRELLRRDGKRYFADYNKVMPVAIAVVSFMMIVGLMAIYLDLADPIKV